MRDRVEMRSECGYCFGKKRLGSLIRLEICEPQTHTAVFNNLVCSRCKEFVVSYWFHVEPTFERYYHPA